LKKLIIIYSVIVIILGSTHVSYAKKHSVPIPEFDGDINQSYVIMSDQDFDEELGQVPLPDSPTREALEDTSFVIVNQPVNKTGSPVLAVLKTAKNSIYIKDIEVEGYELLTDDEIKSATSKYKGKSLSKEDFLQIVQDINKIYANYNIATAKAYIPAQSLTGSVLKIKVVEGKIEKLNVVGNKYTRSIYIKNAISQKEGDIIYIPEIRDQLLKFNKNSDIKLKAYINPGTKFGTSDVTIAVNEQKPYHAGLSFDNTGNTLIGTLKEGITLEHDSLLGFRDRLALNYSRTRSSNSYFGSYSVPIGYNGLRVGGLYNYAPLKITSGELEDLDVEGRTHTYSIFVTKPIINETNFLLSSTLSLNHKRSTTYLDNQSLEDIMGIPATIVSSTDLNLTAVKTDRYGQWIHSSDFAVGARALNANCSFFKYAGNLIRFQNLGHNIQLLLKANMQLAAEELPSLEKFQAGGIYTVRGYSEGYLLGDNGYLLGSELRFPLFILPEKIGSFALRKRVQGVTFFDAGGAFQKDQDKSNLVGIGGGLRIKLSRFLVGRLDYGFGLINRAENASAAKFYFGIDSTPF